MRLKYKKMIFFITMWIMGIGLVTISFRKPENSSSVPTTSSSIVVASNVTPSISVAPVVTQPPTSTPTVTPLPEDPYKLKKNADPYIDDLIKNFYEAMLTSDETVIRSMVTNTSTIDLEKITKKHEYIEAYANFECYTKPGLNDGDLVVYVTYNMKITTIETYAPSLDRWYLVKQGNDYKIVFNNMSNEIRQLLDDYYNSEDIQTFVQQAEEKLNKAKESDSDLNDFINNLIESLTKSSSSKESDDIQIEDDIEE